MQKALGLGSYHTAWEWLYKLRRAMVHLSPAQPQLTEANTLNPLIFMVKCANKGRKTRDEPAKI